MTTVTRYNDRYISRPGDGLEGVGLVSTSKYMGTGTLLGDGRAVLTAAHVLEGNTGTLSVSFDTSGGRVRLPVERYWTHEGYDRPSFGNDLALLWLGEAAPLSVPRYQLYRTNDEIGHVADLVGYGLRGLGAEGYGGTTGVRTVVQNRIDARWDEVSDALSGGGWHPPRHSQLIADFDSGGARQDVLGRLLGRHDTGLGDREGIIAPGDSGGPLFIDGRVAGVASYSAHLIASGDGSFDINQRVDSSFGELGSWQRVSYYQGWIDDVLGQWGATPADSETPPQAPNVSQQEAENVSLLYAAALDRMPDEAGLNFWIDELGNGVALTSIAGAFSDSEEFITRFGATGNTDYIERLYINALDRQPDDSGFAYWQRVMSEGDSRADVLTFFALSDENRVNSSSWLDDLHYDTGSQDWLL